MIKETRMYIGYRAFSSEVLLVAWETGERNILKQG